MSNMYHTESALGRNQRQFENATWEDILRRFANLQTQIKILAGGEEIDVLLQRIEDTITNAQSDVTAAIDANNTATQDAITANNQALQTALNTIAGALTDLDNAIKAADTATADTIAAKEAAIQATEDALTAINQMQGLINNLKSRGPWNSATAFKTNNLAEANGKTYIALQDHTNKPVTDTAYWALFADKGVKGDKGEKGDTGAALSILGKLTDPSQLPPTGTAGDAYTVNGELWVWSENTNAWENVGNIKGEKGDKGEEGDSAYEVAITNGFVGTEAEWLASLKGQKGDKGDPGADADLTQIEQTVSALDTKVTTHLDEIATTEKLGHIKPDGTSIVVNESTGVASIKKSEDAILAVLNSGWTQGSGLDTPLVYFKDSLGYVYLMGTVVSDGAANNILGTLPVGYRPLRRENIPAVHYDIPGKVWRSGICSVTSDGAIYAPSGTTSVNSSARIFVIFKTT